MNKLTKKEKKGLEQIYLSGIMLKIGLIDLLKILIKEYPYLYQEVYYKYFKRYKWLIKIIRNL